MEDKRSIPRCSYPEVLFPVPEQFQGQDLQENPPPCIGVFLYTLQIDRPRSPPLLSFEFFNLLYFRSISTASDIHGHFLGLFVADSDAKDALRFPCDFFDFSRGKPSSHLSESSGFPSYSRRQLVHDHLRLFAKLRVHMNVVPLSTRNTNSGTEN